MLWRDSLKNPQRAECVAHIVLSYVNKMSIVPFTANLDMKNEKCIKIDPDLNKSFSDNSNCSDSEPSNQLGNFNVSTNSLSKDECLDGGSIDCPPVGGINPAMNISASLKVKGLKEIKTII